MKVSVNPIDSAALGRTVVEIADLELSDDFKAAEKDYVARHKPAYVSCRLPIEEVGTIHQLEQRGFQFVETVLRLSLNLKKSYDTSPFPYAFERVENEGMLQPVLEIAEATFVDDRFTIDPQIPAGVSGERYKRYVAKSFAAADERLYRLLNVHTSEVVAFKTHRLLSPQEGLFLLGGVKPEYKRTAIPVINEYFELNLLREQGIERMQTHISARNYAVMNLEIKGLGFRVESSFVVLRKLYPADGALKAP
jgi:hypothetical protein